MAYPPWQPNPSDPWQPVVPATASTTTYAIPDPQECKDCKVVEILKQVIEGLLTRIDSLEDQLASKKKTKRTRKSK
jgi:hypothetical protein